MMDMKAVILSSVSADISDVEVIAALAVARRLVVIRTKLTTYVKERHEHSRNYVVNLCLIIGGPEKGWGARSHWGRFHL